MKTTATGIFETKLPGLPVQTSVTTYSIGADKVYSGSKNPCWRQTIRNGGDATSSYSMYTLDVDGEHSINTEMIDNDNWNRSKLIYPISLASFRNGTFQASNGLINKTQQQFDDRTVKALRQAASPFQGGVFLGELKETLSMLRSPLKQTWVHAGKYLKETQRILKQSNASRAIRDFRGGSGTKDFADSQKHIIRSLNSAYLEFTYGVGPLISDIDSIAEAWHQVGHRHEVDVRVNSSNAEFNDMGNVLQLSYNTWLNQKYSAKHSIRATAFYDFSNQSMQLVGMDLRNFAPTVYQLIPYSFVFDYWTNVGTFIDSLCLPSGSRRYGFVNKKTTIWVFNTPVVDPTVTPDTPKFSLEANTTTTKYTAFTRDPWYPSVSANQVTLHFEDPTVRQYYNQASLVLQRLL